jgi:hypothetical protein
MSNPWSQSFEELRRPYLEEKKKGDGNLANNYPPYDKVTRGDIIAGATGEDQEGGKKKKKKEVEEGYKEIDREKENKMYRRAGNLARTSLSSKGKEKEDARNKSAKIVSAITRQKENERFNRIGKSPAHNEEFVDEGMHRDADTGEVVSKAVPGKTYYPAQPMKKTSVAIEKEKRMKKEDADPCWKNYTQVGMKDKGGKKVPNCVPSKGVPKAKGYKKESSDWKTELGIDDIIEAMVSTGEQDKKLDVKKGIKNKIEINPNLKLEEKGEDCECEPTKKEGKESGKEAKESGKGKHKEYKHPKGKEEKGEVSEAWYSGKPKYRTTASGRKVRWDEDDKIDDMVSKKLYPPKKAEPKETKEEVVIEDREMRRLAAQERAAERTKESQRGGARTQVPGKVGKSDAKSYVNKTMREVDYIDKKTKGKHTIGNPFPEEVQYVDEVSPPGMEGTVKAMKKYKNEIDNPYALAWWMKGKGFKSHKKPSGAPKNEELDYWLGESQEARNNPEKYEREQNKKYAPVRGEKTPMPPRGNKKREDFEKWYAANGPK